MHRREQADYARNRSLPKEVVEAIRRARHSGSRKDWRAAKHRLDKFNRELRRGDAAIMSQLRRHDPKAFFAVMGSYAPEDPSKHEPQAPIPAEDGEPPPAERFLEAFKARLGANNAAVPPGATDPEWLRHVREEPLQAQDRLARPIAPLEVARVIWPLMEGARGLQDMECPASGRVCADCPVCKGVHKAAAEWGGRGDLKRNPPDPRPHLQPQSTINGDLQARYISWGRHEAVKDKFEYRTVLACTTAALLNRYLEAGTLPAATAEILSVPIFKAGSPNRADPGGYRFTAMTGLLAKLMDLVITARVTHHSARVGAVSGAHQGAFTAGMGTEWHPWAVREAARDAWRNRRNVFMVFIDFEKAYDKVHPEAMLAVLERQGVPAKLLTFIRGWFAQRATRMSVNGEVSDAVPTTGGLGQGNVSSPNFFNMFIHSLSVYLEGEGADLGIRVGVGDARAHIVSLAFADDISCPTETPEKAQRVLRLVEAWCAAWGMRMNVGIKKTAVLPLICKQDKAKYKDLPPITLADGTVVPYCTTYKYLGYTMDADMHEPHYEDKLTANILGTMHGNYSRWFKANSLARRLAPAGKLQLAKAVSLSSYLMCMVPWSEAALGRLEAALGRFARDLAGRGRSSSSELAHIMSGMPSAVFLVARERARMLFTLRATDHRTAPAVRVLEAVGTARGSWLAETERRMAALRAEGARDPRGVMGKPPNHVFSMTEVPAAAAIVAREAMRVTQVKKRTDEKLLQQHVVLSAAWVEGPPAQSVTDVLLGGAYAMAAEAGCMRATPVSYCGVGGAGALACKVSVPIPQDVVRAVNASWEGPMALGYAPLGPGAWRLEKTMPTKELRHEVAHGILCPLCKGGLASPRHILVDCTGVSGDLDMVAERAKLRDVARRIAIKLQRLLHAAQGGEEASLALLPVWAIDWTTPTGRNMLHRLLIVAPWPKAAVDDPSAVVARGLGAMFDATLVQNDRLRPIANTWVSWAGVTVLRVCQKWSKEVDVALGFEGPPAGGPAAAVEGARTKGGRPKRVAKPKK